jgi:hypothetical protein
MINIRNTIEHNLLPGFSRQEMLNRWQRSQVIKPLINLIGIKLTDLHARLNGYRFVLATTEAEKQQAYQLRYQIYSEAEYMSTDSGQRAELTDQYDEISAIFLAYYHGQPIGTLRLTPLTNGSNTEDYFNIVLDQDRQHGVDIGKFAIDSRQRSQARIAGVGLVRIAYIYSVRNNIHTWLGCAPQGLLRSFRNFIPTHVLPQFPPTDKHLAHRARRAGYFKKYGAKIQPFQMIMTELDAAQGLCNLWVPLIKVSGRNLAKRLLKT